MSIQSIAGNLGSSVFHSVTGTAQEIGSRIENLLGGAVASVSTLWDGGFVGFDMNNYQILTTAIENHVKQLEEVIDQFNTDAYIDGALKGQARDEAVEYVKAIKTLLQAYATTYRQFNIQLTGAANGVYGGSGSGESIMDQYNTGDQQNAQAIRTESEQIQTEAQSIRID
jgi:hypothetical protein